MSIFKNKPFLIAEIGVNYYDIAKKENISNMEAAKLMVKEAKESGCDGVKFQTYKAETIASKNSPAYWDLNEEPTTSQFELFKKFDSFGKDQYRELADYCNEIGIMFLSTPFDFESVDYLDEFMDVYKISSSDLNNIPFIKKIALKGKPIILSTGASTMEEVKNSIKVIEDTNPDIEIGILHCVLSYPTDFEDANLLMIKNLKDTFPDYDIGYSDHTKPDDKMLTLTTAYLYGADIIEKHFTLDKTLKGNDHYHAMDPDDVRVFKDNIRFINTINGQYEKVPLPCESESRLQARRSIVAASDIQKGQRITEEMLTFKRPGSGISPDKIDSVIGKTAKSNIYSDDILSYDMFE
ncbi:MAG: N-acetylneuraminate synthase family protein [Methanobrevibacter boviskoreani]|jgi:sialic acid synthase SpsE|uniref:N-acetylneuraminate synthase family protein n=1 Tax=Methanobrevibacter boviskoreani TaxID=1348249 RepID=UPI0023A80A4A|nr:N-acetylneuraminate synthase family protein [Methanobrevibacter boviskoreani]MCI6931203.1 N-acetylneuraminate synthase family protein [Methanobrevibacter boviskoreani]MDD6256337.1 N-acetylneuraminate synthase family protein [Methanobrevibacter boviskoreani]